MTSKEEVNLKNEYYKLIDSLKVLTQEEVEELYNSEHIPYTDLEAEINALQKKNTFIAQITEIDEEIKELEKKLPTISYRYFLTIIGRKHKIRKYPSKELRNKIVEGNMHLAKIYASIFVKNSNNTLDFDELYSLATESLLSAAHYYIPGGPATFQTYASKCIRNKLNREIYKKKNKPSKKANFFEKEKHKIEELSLFLESEKMTEPFSSSSTYYKSEDSRTSVGIRHTRYFTNTYEEVLVRRLKRIIMEFNKHKYLRQEQDKTLSKRNYKTLDEILDRFTNLIKDSKINTLITDCDREDVESYINYYGISKVEANFHRAKYYLEIYKKKLEFIELFIKAENTLQMQGIEINDNNVMNQINSYIKNINAEIHRLRNEGFFNNPDFAYKRLKDYYNEYIDTYNVDLFAFPNKKDSRQTEKLSIAASYEELICDEAKLLLEKLDAIKTPSVVAYMNTDFTTDNCNDLIIDILPYEIPQELAAGDRDDYLSNLSDEIGIDYYRIISKSQAREELEMTIKKFCTEETYVKAVLKERADVVNKKLKKKNAPIIQNNVEARKKEDLYNRGSKYYKYFNTKTYQQLRDDINLLYTDDPDIFDYLLEKSPTKKQKLSLEDEALDSIFISDYHKCLEELSAIEKEIMLMSYDDNGYRNLTIKEIAKILGKKTSTIKTEKSKAIKKLRKNQILQSYNQD